MSDKKIEAEITAIMLALEWESIADGGWVVELMGTENGGGAEWKMGTMADAKISPDVLHELVRAWGTVPAFEHVWFAHSFRITPALRLMELLWKFHQRGKTPFDAVGVWWHDAPGVVGGRYWFFEGKEPLRIGSNLEILDRAFVRESILPAEHIEQEIIDAVEKAKRQK